MVNLDLTILLKRWIEVKTWRGSSSGVARAFPGGRLAHPEGQNEEENSKVWGKNDQNLRKKLGKWNSCPPGTVRLATTLGSSMPFHVCINKLQDRQAQWHMT